MSSTMRVSPHSSTALSCKLSHANKRRKRNVFSRSDNPCIAVVDAFSTGFVLAARIKSRGLNCIAVYSEQIDKLDSVRAMVPHGMHIEFDGVIHWNDDINVMVKDIKNCPHNVIQVIAGAEPGVELSDQLSELLSLRSNGTKQSIARRNKYAMGETIRAAGIRAVQQRKVSSMEDFKSCLADWTNREPFVAIVKPLDSAGSDSISLCHSTDEACTAFLGIIGKPNALGLTNHSVLLQEYLHGPEYIVDCVSRDGVHKVAAIWEYDKRSVNGAAFVYFGQTLLCASDDHCEEIIAYERSVLDALGIKHGPSHGEVKWCNGSPVLVEVGARCNGAEGAWIELTDRVLGCNQVDMTLDAYLDKDAFDAYPEKPLKRNGYSKMAYLVSFVEGVFSHINTAYSLQLQQMESFVHMEICFEAGQHIIKTVDCFTWGGIVKLYHIDEHQVSADYNRIREMELSGLFVVE